MKLEPFRCPICRKRKLLAAGRNHWCMCLPKAPARMVPVAVSRIVAKVLRNR